MLNELLYENIDTTKYEEIDTSIKMSSNYAYLAVLTGFNATILTSCIPTVASAAPLIGLIVGCGMVYWATLIEEYWSKI